MYRVGLEAILGFTRRGDVLEFAPCVPAAWPEFALTYRYGRSSYAITVERPAAARPGNQTITLDGQPLDGETIPLVDDGGRHEVVIRPRTSNAPGVG
jgi:cyclic beta-1,2-glucan synthetase